jgi:hypothetical protein
VGNAGGTYEDTNLHAIHHDGTPVDNFPYLMPGGAEGHIALVDITGDAKLEILFTNNLQDSGQGYLFAIDASATLLEGWPLRPEGLTYLHGVTVGDVDGDGIPEIGTMGNKVDNTASVNLYSYKGYAFGNGGVHWRTYQADNFNTGLYNPVGGGDDDDTDDDDDVTDDDSADDDAADDDDDDDAVDDDAADDDDTESPGDDDSDDDDNDDDEACCG